MDTENKKSLDSMQFLEGLVKIEASERHDQLIEAKTQMD